jgi:uncharacterized membrane protein SpoIIM required for sporulation
VIIDLQKFVTVERPCWAALESVLNKLEAEPRFRMPLEQLQHFHYLYERASADLAKITTFSSEPETRRYLESLVARAYGEIHETREKQHRLSPFDWFFQTLPQTFRRHIRAFWLSVAITMAGVVFGGFAVAFDPEAKSVILPEMFAGHLGDPSERVAREERNIKSHSAGVMTSFSAQLMTNNIRVSILALALGMSFGVGTIIVLFYNGIILGLVAVDYVLAGQTTFLLGWLLPHGVIEIPAILIGGQAGLMLAGALIGWGHRLSITARLRAIARDLVTLIFGVVLMLIWAGIVESFLSQYHEPVIPYWVKIGFGSIELGLLILFLSRAGAGRTQSSSIAWPRLTHC